MQAVRVEGDRHAFAGRVVVRIDQAGDDGVGAPLLLRRPAGPGQNRAVLLRHVQVDVPLAAEALHEARANLQGHGAGAWRDMLRTDADHDVAAREGRGCGKGNVLAEQAHDGASVPGLDGRAQEVHARRPDEARDEEVGGPSEHGVGIGDLLDHPVAHDDDPVRHRHGLDLVRENLHQHRLSLPKRCCILLFEFCHSDFLPKAVSGKSHV